MTDLIEIQGQYSRAQLHELLKAVEVSKTVLFQMGGDDRSVDMAIEERLKTLSFWQVELENKLQ